jgi:hypothetical protein
VKTKAKTLFDHDVLRMFVITANPSDFPGKFVVRENVIARGSSEPILDPAPLAVVDTITEARAAVPPDRICMPRSPKDPPVVVETWF